MSDGMRISQEFTFDAAHKLGGVQADGSGDARYARLHGHSFQVCVSIAGEPDPETGWVADFGAVREALDAIRTELDHAYLNEIAGLETPTLERIALWIAGRLKPQFKGLANVTVARPSNG
ncbi:MAG: 6-carboxytetrahydropterin synthase, partial [Pseudomonadota bacterium]